MTIDDKLVEAVEKIRRDKYQPWRYILFTFLNGIAQGLGVTLGATLVLGIIIYILSMVLTKLINFPVLGFYFGEIIKIMDAYIKHAPRP